MAIHIKRSKQVNLIVKKWRVQLHEVGPSSLWISVILTNVVDYFYFSPTINLKMHFRSHGFFPFLFFLSFFHAKIEYILINPYTQDIHCEHAKHCVSKIIFDFLIGHHSDWKQNPNYGMLLNAWIRYLLREKQSSRLIPNCSSSFYRFKKIKKEKKKKNSNEESQSHRFVSPKFLQSNIEKNNQQFLHKFKYSECIYLLHT